MSDSNNTNTTPTNPVEDEGEDTCPHRFGWFLWNGSLGYNGQFGDQNNNNNNNNNYYCHHHHHHPTTVPQLSFIPSASTTTTTEQLLLQDISSSSPVVTLSQCYCCMGVSLRSIPLYMQHTQYKYSLRTEEIVKPSPSQENDENNNTKTTEASIPSSTTDANTTHPTSHPLECIRFPTDYGIPSSLSITHFDQTFGTAPTTLSAASRKISVAADTYVTISSTTITSTTTIKNTDCESSMIQNSTTSSTTNDDNNYHASSTSTDPQHTTTIHTGVNTTEIYILTIVHQYSPIKRIQIRGCTAWMKMDWCGIGGYQQILFLPHLLTLCGNNSDTCCSRSQTLSSSSSSSSSSLTKDHHMDADTTTTTTGSRNFWNFVLQHSILTDGINWWLPDGIGLQKILSKDDATLKYQIIMPTWKYLADTEWNVQEHESEENHSMIIQDSPQMITEPSLRLLSGWRKTLQDTMRDQIVHHQQMEQRERILHQRQGLLLQQSRLLLQQWSTNSTSGIVAEKWIIWEVRYRSKPCSTVTALHTSGSGEAVAIFIEVDLRYNANNNDTELLPLSVHQVHLSVSLSKSQNHVKVVTRSAVAPTLETKTDRIVTMNMLVHLEGLQYEDIISSQKGLELTIHGHWSSNTVRTKYIPKFSSTNQPTRCGCTLITFCLPMEVVFVSLPTSTTTSTNNNSTMQRIYQHDDDDDNSNNHIHTASTMKLPKPSIVFDFREPILVDIDLSSIVSSINWDHWIVEFNHYLADTFHSVNICPITTKPMIHKTLLVHCYPLAAFQGLIHIIRQRLPDHVIVMERPSEVAN